MKRIALIVLAISLLMLSGCSHSEEKAFIEFAESVAKADTVSFKGHVAAEYSVLSANFDFGFPVMLGKRQIEVCRQHAVFRGNVAFKAYSVRFCNAFRKFYKRFLLAV